MAVNDRLFDSKPMEELYAKIDYLIKNDFILTDADFYPPSDNRVWKSVVKDIDGGDNFADYCEEFFELLDEEEYF